MTKMFKNFCGYETTVSVYPCHSSRPVLWGWCIAVFDILHIKLQPAIFPLCKRVIRFHELPTETIQCFSQYGLKIIDSLNSIEHCLNVSSTYNISTDDKGRSDKDICFDMTLSFELINDKFHHFVWQYVYILYNATRILFGLKHYISIF